MHSARIYNLNLFRAIAIIMVIYFHVTQMFFSKLSLHENIYTWGKFGVEFFFVLSGFLIGGIYYKSNTRVNLFKFWLQRFLRTYPPYLIALIISFIPVSFLQQEKFDLGYLLFFQNFYEKIPFFLVSWSLCVEEHFYLFFPLILLLFSTLIQRQSVQLFAWIAISLVPIIFRTIYGSTDNLEFGFYKTATIFRYDGIALGCLLSFLVYRIKIDLNVLRRFSFLIILFALTSIYINQVFDEVLWIYRYGYFFLNISLVLMLALFYVSRDFLFSKSFFVKITASMAYSLYLTHALSIHVVVRLANRFQFNPYLSMLFSFFLIFAVGYCFYVLIERPTIRARDLLLSDIRVSFYRKIFRSTVQNILFFSYWKN